MKLSSYLPLSTLLTTSTVATNLYVSSYAGTITSLQLSQAASGTYSLNQVAVNDGSAPNPSWLTLDENTHVVYCLDEGLDVVNGSIASYSTSASGELTQIDRHTVISGPVSSVVFNGGKALAAAH
jgi:6-phosphogluconolactonase (cycloisomerase 2 family)